MFELPLAKASAPPDRPGNGNGHGGAGAPGQIPNPDAIPGSPFQYAAPEGSAKTMSAVLGEIVWLMSQSQLHKSFFISDLEWPVAQAAKRKNAAQAANENKPMTPVILKQFRLFYDQETSRSAWCSGAGCRRRSSSGCRQGTSKLRPQDWTSGDRLWVVEVIAPFGGAEEMVKDLKAAVFPDREIRMLVVKDGVKDVRAV